MTFKFFLWGFLALLCNVAQWILADFLETIIMTPVCWIFLGIQSAGEWFHRIEGRFITRARSHLKP